MMRFFARLLTGFRMKRRLGRKPELCHWCAGPLHLLKHMRAYDGMWEHESCNARNRRRNAGRAWRE